MLTKRERVTVIAELGINHLGNIDLAKEMIKGAVNAGADLIKLQKRDLNSTYSKEELDKPRESPYGLKNRDLKEQLEFNVEEYDIIDEYCRKLNIPWFASPWDLKSVDFLEQYNPKYYKIPSALITHKELCEKIAKLGKYTYIATGMSTVEEIIKVVALFKACGNTNFELMHCNSTYPCPDEDLNMSLIPYLRKLFCCKIGYSGHSAGIMDGIMATVLGATSVEKHVTTNRTMYGTDQASSLEIHGLAKMIEYIRYVETAMGQGVKSITPLEAKVRAKLGRSKDYTY